MTVVLVYIVCADAKEAKTIAKTLVEEKLVACANIIPAVQSLFFWKGQMQKAREALLLCKTISEKMAAVEKRVKSVHSYKVPCICFYKSESTSPEYEKWLLESLR